MLTGNSQYHVNQGEGKLFSIDSVEGYYNDLTEKITRFGMPNDEIPITQDDDGTPRHFSIAIFQYGLAAYDLYLEHHEDIYLRKFWNCVRWAIDNQEENGGWNSFGRQNDKEPFSAMAQGEGISLLVRAFILTQDQLYFDCASKALKFLLKPREEGGVCEKSDSELLLYEFTFYPLVLNGWIFAAWGIFDFFKISRDLEIGRLWQLSIKSIKEKLPEFDCGYWSKYNIQNIIASPFYHKLHVAQLNVMYKLTGEKEFKKYAIRWQKQYDNVFFKMGAFIYKAYQKVILN